MGPALRRLLISLAAGLSLVAMFLIVGFTATVVHAAEDHLVAKLGNVVVTIYTTPCTSKPVLENIKPDYHAKFKKANVLYAGKNLEACWTLHTDGSIYVMDEDGDPSPPLSPEVFGPEETI